MVKIFSWLLLCLLIISRRVKSDCTELNCKLSDYKRCYPIYSLIQSEKKIECKCLKGLYTLNDKCIGVIRYDFNFVLFISPVLIQPEKILSALRTLVQSIPKVAPLTANINMNIESIVFKKFTPPESTKVYSKLVLWKTDTQNPLDLPQISIDQMATFLRNYLNANVAYNPALNMTLINSNFAVGYFGDYTNYFLTTWSLSYNNWTCSTDLYTHCEDHTECVPSLGSVKCKCNEMISVDVSPQVSLFPGERCNYTCDLNCWNGGMCFYKFGKPSCYCYLRFIGDHCEIDVIILIIVLSCVVGLLLLLSICCGICDYVFKKKHEEREKDN